MYRKNVAGQHVCFQGVDTATGGIKSGVTWTVRRCIDGTFAAATGTVTEDGTTGFYKFAMSQADSNGNDISFNFTGTGAVPQTVNIVTTAGDPTDSVRFGLTSLPNATAGGAGGVPVVGTGANNFKSDASANVTFANTSIATVTDVTNNVNAVLANVAHGGAAASMNLASGLTANITGNLSGSVGSVTGAVGSVTGNVGGNVSGSVGSVTAGVSLAATATSAQLVDDIWDEATAGHATAGTTGKALTDAGSAGDPWGTALPGAYAAGTAGKIVGDNLNATVGSRLATAGYTAPLDAAGTRAAVGLATANLDTQLDALPTAVENADALLARNVSNVEATAGEHTLCTVVLAALENSISGTTMTIKRTDGVTTHATKTVTTDAAAEPITGVS